MCDNTVVTKRIATNGFGQGKGGPVLQLYQSCRVMLPTERNIYVLNGQANATQATVVNIQFKIKHYTYYCNLGQQM
jgi:hypothetical protein